MPLAALLTWMMTAAGGLYLLTIWLIEYDREFQSVAATRLPVPVISSHALLAVTGLGVWAIYLLTDRDELSWAAAGILVVVAILGLTMAARWIGVYRAYGSRPRRAHVAGRGTRRRGSRLRRPHRQPDGHSARTPFPAAGRHPAWGVRAGHRRPGAADGADQELTAYAAYAA